MGGEMNGVGFGFDCQWKGIPGFGMILSLQPAPAFYLILWRFRMVVGWCK